MGIYEQKIKGLLKGYLTNLYNETRVDETINPYFTTIELDEEYVSVKVTSKGTIDNVTITSAFKTSSERVKTMLEYGDFSKSIGKQEEETVELLLDDEDEYDE